MRTRALEHDTDAAAAWLARVYTPAARGVSVHRHRRARSASARPGSPNGWPRRIDGTAVLEDADNPFLADFYNERPGAALQAQLFYLLNRHRQLTGAPPGRPVRAHDGLRLPLRSRQDLRVSQSRRQRAVHLSAALRPAGRETCRHPISSSICRRRPTCCCGAFATSRPIPSASCPQPDADYVRELNEAYQHFFFHYTATPLLVVETSQFEPETSDEALDDLRAADQQRMGKRNAVLRAADAKDVDRTSFLLSS